MSTAACYERERRNSLNVSHSAQVNSAVAPIQWDALQPLKTGPCCTRAFIGTGKLFTVQR